MNRVPPVNRLLTILLGYVAATCAGAVIPTAGYLLLGYIAFGKDVEPLLIPVAAFAFVRTVGLSLLPVVAIITFTEALMVQAVSAYVLFGIFLFIGCAIYLVPHDVLRLAVLSGMTSGGIVAGLVYWKIAGRNAGRWRQGQQQPA